MNRKTPSDPATDILGMDGIRRHLRQVSGFCRELVKRHPLYFFAGMLACMLASGILAFTVMRTDEPHALPAFPKPPASGAGGAITGIIDTYAALNEVTALQDTIAHIIEKDTLDATDSIRLTEALRRFEQIQQSIMNHKNNDTAP
ncbi:hypothetical protein [Parapedobacter soli]|uniref:hypothetical protein n=1 Tax=Parapedobacter soli TaxID=416955 RepID=UPI0021C6B684|nr:hypothetical protein [Parapedobacter soli]